MQDFARELVGLGPDLIRRIHDPQQQQSTERRGQLLLCL